MNILDFLQRFQRHEIPIVLDTPELESHLCALGFSTMPLKERTYDDASLQPSLLLVGQLQTFERLRQWWGTCQVPLCHLALARFDASIPSVRYALSRLLQVDIEESLERRRLAYEQLFSSSGLEVTTAAGACLIHTRDSLEVPNHGSELEAGRLYSITEFLEASIVNLEAETSSFNVEGVLTFDGMNVLCNRPDQRAEFGEKLSLLQRRSSHGDNWIKVRQNRIVELYVGGEDATEYLLGLVGERERGMAITEFGIGCSSWKDGPDFALNALINKVVAGVYIGMGMGWLFPHIDFISGGAEYKFST